MLHIEYLFNGGLRLLAVNQILATQHFPLLFISPSMTADSGEGGGGVAVRQEAGPTQRL